MQAAASRTQMIRRRLTAPPESAAHCRCTQIPPKESSAAESADSRRKEKPQLKILCSWVTSEKAAVRARTVCAEIPAQPPSRISQPVMPVSSQIIVWYSKMLCRMPWLISA